MNTYAEKESVRNATPRCKFNDGVLCGDQEHCAKCGWNPEVYKERLRRYYKKHNIHEEDTEA